MRKHNDTFGWLVLFGFLLLLAGCTKHAQPTAVPRPTPDELDIYVMLTEKYTSYDVIVQVYDVPVSETLRRLHALQAVTPPTGLEALHQKAIDGYSYICEGKQLLPGANSVVRAEAFFMIEWGISRLLDYREHLDQAQQ